MRRNSNALTALATIALVALATHAAAQSRSMSLDAARYSPAGELEFPDDTARWILLGASLGGEYADEPFDSSAPGAFGIVQMEPSAYEYFLEHGEYADGTMLLLTFYPAQGRSEPPLQGFTQGDPTVREIHVIDRARFGTEGRAFFVYPPGVGSPVAAVPPGNDCVTCHNEHGEHDATFTQFYPALRHLTQRN